MRQFEGIREPKLSSVVAGAKEVHVSELGSCLCHGIEALVGERDPIGFMQRGQSLFVQATEGVNQGLGQREREVTRSRSASAPSASLTTVRSEWTPAAMAPAKTAADPDSTNASIEASSGS